MTRHRIAYLVLVPIACLLMGACGDVVGENGDDGDTSTDTEPGDTTGDSVDDTTDPDGGDTAGDPSDVPDDTPDDPADVPADTPTDGELCGNGTVDTGEECDDTSDFCVDCELVPPTDWIECTDSAGNTAFFFIEDWSGTHTATEFRDHCRDVVDGFSPDDFAFYGLATLYDQDLWDCVEPRLDGSTSYYVGLEQDTSASDYSEPDGGWYWTAWDGSGWSHVDPFDHSSSYLGGSFDNGGGPGTAECGRMQQAGGSWDFLDYSCDSPQTWDGICMIRF